ncbi:MAG: methylated-DNA--[protein]-cysteine S-methyltransferase [Gammaproteobacteria bacterium]|jgi:AraC family transcriptional regulator of adaptative response/methylated-DNA-[protein]-cysteine methyltransferase
MISRPTRIDWPRTLLKACRLIEAAEAVLPLARLAETLHVSPSELQRQFTSRLGISPRAYGQALKLHRLARGVANSGNTLNAIFNAGFESVASGYDSAAQTLGVSPGKLLRDIQVGWWLGLSDMGWMLMAATEKGICWLTFGEEPGAMLEELRTAFPNACFYNDEERLFDWFDRVREFILLPKEALDLPLDIQGTAFQAGVWKALRQIPLGRTASYSDIARRIGKPSAARAVASACARNHIALLIPCHRVIGTDGRVAGYRWGVERKATLLQREKR